VRPLAELFAAAIIFRGGIGERMPTVMPVKGSWSDSGGGEAEVAMEPGTSDAKGVDILHPYY
jgi:hypothetical protein